MPLVEPRVRLRELSAVLLLLTVLAAMLLTSGQMADIRVAFPALSSVMNWLEALDTPFDMDHVALFAVLGACLRLLLPRVSWGWLLLLLAALAASTELLQFFTVGRTPKLLDARDDMIGATLGLLAAWVPLSLMGVWKRRLVKLPQPHARGMSDQLRTGLAARLVGSPAPSLAELVHAHGVDKVLAGSVDEGIVSLLEARLHDEGFMVPMELLQPLAVRALACRARAMRWAPEVARIQQRLADAGIPTLWLKGAALAHWLYPQPFLRDVADIDLLLPDHATALRVAELLAPLGYAMSNPHIAGNLVVHELQVWSERHRLELDLHWDLSNGALFADRLRWAELEAGAMPLPGLGSGALGLGCMHALLHACMHRAANALVGQQDRLRWLYDIHLLAATLNPDDWEQLKATAARTAMADPVLAGLQASRTAFGTEVPVDVTTTLAAHARMESVRTDRLSSWTYYQWSTFMALPRRLRLRWLRQLLFPDMGHLRARYGADGGGRIRLLWRRLLDGVSRWRNYVGV